MPGVTRRDALREMPGPPGTNLARDGSTPTAAQVADLMKKAATATTMYAPSS